MTHGARALQPNGFRFRLILREVPGLSANPLGFRGGGGTAVQDRETEASPPKYRPAESSRWLSATGSCQVGVICATFAAFACTCASVPSSSLPSQRGIPGQLDRPRHSRPDPSLPLHRHHLRRCCRRHRHCRCLCHRRHTFGQTKRGGLCCRPAVPNAPLVGIFKCLLNCGCRRML